MTIRVTKRFDQVGRMMTQAETAALQDAVDHLLEDANRTVPIEYGDLAGSGAAEAEGLTGQVSYNTPYARVQHEKTWYRHDPGRRAKWLQLTFQERATDVGRWLAATISKRMR